MFIAVPGHVRTRQVLSLFGTGVLAVVDHF
jgi:hypothetical protein